MGKLTEYLKLLPLAWENRDKVFEGITNKIKKQFKMLPEDEQEEIIRRKLICEVCPFNSKNAKKDGYVTARVDDHCIQCSCNIDFKTSCLMCNCGIEVWNQNHPKEQIPLKWEVYIKKPNL